MGRAELPELDRSIEQRALKGLRSSRREVNKLLIRCPFDGEFFHKLCLRDQAFFSHVPPAEPEA